MKTSDLLKIVVFEEDARRRRTICRFLRGLDFVEVVGSAAGEDSLLKAAAAHIPDVVVVSTYTGGGEGLSAVRSLMANFPRPVLIASARSGRGAGEALETLRCGAIDIVPHPADLENADLEAEEKQRSAALFREKLSLVSRIKVIRHIIPFAIPDREGRSKPALRKAGKNKVVAIGASTGGPLLLQNLFQTLPGDTPAAFLVVQHILKHVTSELTARLANLSRLRVKVGEMNEPIIPGYVYIAPGNCHLQAGPGRRIVLDDGPEVSGHRPSVDRLMESVAREYGELAIGVLLTGMGRDGVRGMSRIKSSGGVTVAQDEATSVVFGMPGAAIESGVADYVVPAEDLAVKILELV